MVAGAITVCRAAAASSRAGGKDGTGGLGCRPITQIVPYTFIFTIIVGLVSHQNYFASLSRLKLLMAIALLIYNINNRVHLFDIKMRISKFCHCNHR